MVRIAGKVGSQPKEGGMAEGDLPGIAHEEVQADDDHDIQGRHVQDHEVIIVPEQDRQGENDSAKR